MHFHLGSGDVNMASAIAYTSQAGQGARALVVGATWKHQFMTFHCNEGPDQGDNETHEVWSPYEWDPHVSTGTPPVYDGLDSQVAMQQQPASIMTPDGADQKVTIDAGVSEVYETGGGVGIGAVR